MIRAVVFDIGNVLLDFDYGIFVRRMAPRTRLEVSALDRLLNQSPLLAEFESGRMNSDAFFKAVQTETGYEGGLEEFAAQFEDIFTPNDEVIAMHEQIAASGLPTFTFSNTNPMAVSHIRRAYPFWPRFTGHVLSYEQGALKPDPKIYEVLETATGCAGNEIAYLDDRPENIATAQARGWQATQFNSPSQARKMLEDLGTL